jgi:hypothetical protein
MRFDASDDFGSFVTVQLGKAVTCVEPPPPPPPFQGTFLELFRAQRLQAVPGSDTDITSGGAVRRINLATATTTVAELEGEYDFPEFTNALSDGSYLVHTELGDVYRAVPGGDPVRDTTISPYDQPRHVMAVSENVIALASAYGDLGLINYAPGGGFVDTYRDLTVLGGPQQTGTNLQALWVSPDGATMIGAVTEGDGDAAFNDTRAAIIIPNDVSGTIDKVILPDVIDFTIDFDARHQMQIMCQEQGAALFLCVFTAGFEDPAFNSASVDKQYDGYVVIFNVDTASQTASTIFWEYENARVGGGIFPVAGGMTGVAVANQFSGEIDVWHIDGALVDASFSQFLVGKCPNPVDLITIADGTLGALACQADAFGPTNGVLVVKNLHAQVPLPAAAAAGGSTKQ